MQQQLRQFETSMIVSADFARQIPKKQEAFRGLVQEASQHLKVCESFYEEVCRFKERSAREIFKSKQS